MNSATVSTPAGPFTILASEDAQVLAAGFTTDESELLALVHPTLRTAPHRRADLGPVTAAVKSYLDGDLAAIDDIPVRQHTDGAFLAGAWRSLRDVKPGEPVTYTEFATRLGRPAAVRAAAQACSRNAAALFVPCHRVIRADQTQSVRAVPSARRNLGGYRWGMDVKMWLLAHESQMRIV